MQRMKIILFSKNNINKAKMQQKIMMSKLKTEKSSYMPLPFDTAGMMPKTVK